MIRSIVVFLSLVLVLTAKPVVLTAIPALKAIGDELVEGTDISIINPIGNETPINELTEKIKSESAIPDSVIASAEAVISLRSIMEEDYLFIHCRKRKIRLIEIDAASPLNPTLTSVGVIRNNDHINPYIWLSPSAVIRSAEIIGKDLEALFPKHKEKIEANLQAFRAEIRALRSDYEMKFLSLDAFEAATMDHSFDYFLRDINLFVTMSFPGEMEWEETHFDQFKQGLHNKSFATVIHRWEPFGDMTDLAVEANVPFTVLQTGMPGMNNFDNGIIGFLKMNYDALYKGLSK